MMYCSGCNVCGAVRNVRHTSDPYKDVSSCRKGLMSLSFNLMIPALLDLR